MLTRRLDYRRRNHSQACINKSPGARGSPGPSLGLVLRNFSSSHGLYAPFGNELPSPGEFLGLPRFHLSVCSPPAGRRLERLRGPALGPTPIPVGCSSTHPAFTQQTPTECTLGQPRGWNRRKTRRGSGPQRRQPTARRGHKWAGWCSVVGAV